MQLIVEFVLLGGVEALVDLRLEGSFDFWWVVGSCCGCERGAVTAARRGVGGGGLGREEGRVEADDQAGRGQQAHHRRGESL